MTLAGGPLQILRANRRVYLLADTTVTTVRNDHRPGRPTPDEPVRYNHSRARA